MFTDIVEYTGTRYMAKIVQVGVQVAVGKIGAASEDFTMTAKKRFFVFVFVLRFVFFLQEYVRSLS